jgi:hypothetical protein
MRPTRNPLQCSATQPSPARQSRQPAIREKRSLPSAWAAPRLCGHGATLLRFGHAPLAEALRSVRPSVSAEQAAAHDDHARRLREGMFLAGAVPPPRQRTLLVP